MKRATALVTIFSAFLFLSTSPMAALSSMWVTNPPMNVARVGHSATLLSNGKVLVAGGSSFPNLTKTELYDPNSGTWTVTGAMYTFHNRHTATLLPNGKVLIAGGSTNVCELYDPNTGQWKTTGTMVDFRRNHTATLLKDGRVLISGGIFATSMTQCEIYDPNTEQWITTGSMNSPRGEHTATLLPDGRVLAAGGIVSGGIPFATNSAELYDPTTGTWTPTGSLNVGRYFHTATLLTNGMVLVVGGNTNSSTTASAELYDPSNGTWTVTGSLNTARWGHAAHLIGDGRVLVTGGSTMEYYNPIIGAWTAVSVAVSGTGVTDVSGAATLLPGGAILICGNPTTLSGGTTNNYTFVPSFGFWTTAATMNAGRSQHTATLLTNGEVLVVGGIAAGHATNSAERFNAASNVWTITGSLNTARQQHTATLLSNGKVLVAAGTDVNGAALASAELYDSVLGTWTNTASLNFARSNLTATLLPNGKVLVVGGPANTELYDPVTETWTLTGSLNIARTNFTANLLPNGKVLVVGGNTHTGPTNSAELYDPITGQWSYTGAMATNRASHASVLVGGKVLIPSTTSTIPSELYDPTTGTWSKTKDGPRFLSTGQTAIVLPDGNVLIITAPNTSLYTPVARSFWTVAPSSSGSRNYNVLTLLPDRRILLTGGGNVPEIYDVGLRNAWRPIITSINPSLSPGDVLVVGGTSFQSASESSSGNIMGSPADYPVLQLRAIDSGQIGFTSITNWSTNMFTTTAVWNFPPGQTLATVSVNGVDSPSAIINITVPAADSNALTGLAVMNTNGFQFSFTNRTDALFGMLMTTNVALPFSSWTILSSVNETAPGQFQFLDSAATNSNARFYRLFSP